MCKQESVECRVCRASTRKQEYDTYFYDVTACELAAEERRQPRRRLGQLLHAIEAASHRACSKDEGTSPFFCYCAPLGRMAGAHLPTLDPN